MFGNKTAITPGPVTVADNSTGPFSEIEVLEQEISACSNKLDKLERRLRVDDLSEEQTKSLQQEEKELKKKLADKESDLWQLRKENGKTSVISFIFIGVIAAVYFYVWGS